MNVRWVLFILVLTIDSGSACAQALSIAQLQRDESVKIEYVTGDLTEYALLFRIQGGADIQAAVYNPYDRSRFKRLFGIHKSGKKIGSGSLPPETVTRLDSLISVSRSDLFKGRYCSAEGYVVLKWYRDRQGIVEEPLQDISCYQKYLEDQQAVMGFDALAQFLGANLKPIRGY